MIDPTVAIEQLKTGWVILGVVTLAALWLFGGWAVIHEMRRPPDEEDDDR